MDKFLKFRFIIRVACISDVNILIVWIATSISSENWNTGDSSKVLKFLNTLLNTPGKKADSRHQLARSYSECQTRIAALEAELERMSRPFMGYMDEGARDRSQAEEALAALDLINTKRALRAEVIRFDEIKSRMEGMDGGAGTLNAAM